MVTGKGRLFRWMINFFQVRSRKSRPSEHQTSADRPLTGHCGCERIGGEDCLGARPRDARIRLRQGGGVESPVRPCGDSIPVMKYVLWVVLGVVVGAVVGSLTAYLGPQTD